MSVNGDADKSPVSRVLSAGAKGADRVAHAAGVDRALDQAVEEAIVRALRSPAVIRAIERALESDAVTAELRSEEIRHVVRRALESDGAANAWKEILESEQAQMLVERVAGAPEIRAAIASQSAGLITDIGVRLTIITEGLDDAMERIVRPRDPDSETDQAGLATRLVAAGVDLGLLLAAYSLISSGLATWIPGVFGAHRSAGDADRPVRARSRRRRRDLRRLLGAGGTDAGDALPCDPRHPRRLAGDHVRLCGSSCAGPDREPAAARDSGSLRFCAILDAGRGMTAGPGPR